MNKSLAYILIAFLYMKTNCAETSEDIFDITALQSIKDENPCDIFQFIKPLPEFKVIKSPTPPIPEHELEYIKQEFNAIHQQTERIELLLRAILDRYDTQDVIIEKTIEPTQKNLPRKRKRKQNNIDRSTSCKKNQSQN
ncbi:MAG: hypothetical protein WD055_04050 [Candidatus Dependentiae bacterium]